MDKMREEFEDWAISCEMCTYLDNAEYRHQSTEWAWRAWKASRAALCVELPEREVAGKFVNEFECGHEMGFNDALSDCKIAIEKQGVSYK